MLDALDLFRIRAGGRPLLLTALLLTVLVILQRTLPRGHARSWEALSFRVVGLAGVLGLVSYVLVAAWYASDPHFFDNAEPSVVALAWLYHIGKPVYHSVDSAERVIGEQQPVQKADRRRQQLIPVRMGPGSVRE